MACHSPFFHIPDSLATVLTHLLWGPTLWTSILVCMLITNSHLSGTLGSRDNDIEVSLGAIVLHLAQLVIAVQWWLRAKASAATKEIVMPPIVASCAIGVVGIVTSVMTLFCSFAGVDDDFMWGVSRVVLATYILPLAELAFVFSSACLLNRLQPRSTSSPNMPLEYSYERERRRFQIDTAPSAPPYHSVSGNYPPPLPPRRRRVSFRNALSSPTPSPLSEKSDPCAADVRRDGYLAYSNTGIVPTPVETLAYYAL